ncbi:3-deoxy-D-manno-octulosonic acid transferase [Camelimonas fluminis]|uniref:3-deoxy-D-manno-octulosonic acid transferase n=1 Tax=Camelimonas fluminis TaxID=1576911 RepID=A0ABV7UDB4_9HYPH|nr:3-deoxy-D-manno-octulosonic acid transferase [Camelimonas fluminis]GHE47199.1 3-deoxy-D-manno-octulosonic acid transferase [Camelimonas fluminis]
MTDTPLTLRLYRAAMSLAEPFAPLLLAARRRRGKEDGDRIAERRGVANTPRPAGRLAWLHGASVGETISILPIIERLTQRGFTVLVTSGTVTSAGVLAERLPPGAFHQFAPLDTPRYIRRFLDHWQPDLALVAESELWPNMIVALEKRGVPLILVNGRMSERSFRRWQRAPKTARALLGCIDVALTQTPADAERLARLGAPRVTIAGNLKFDAPAPPADTQTLALMQGQVSGRPVWLAASTHGVEDEIACYVHMTLKERWPDLLTFIAPRHPHRAEDVARMAEEEGLEAMLRSEGYAPGSATEIYIIDVMGELGLYFRLAQAAFIGGSLVNHGGHNPIEPAKLRTPILHGPHVHNFSDVYAAFDGAGGAVPVTDAEELAEAISTLLQDAARGRDMTRAAAGVVDRYGGALERTLQAIEPYILQMELERL